MTGGPTQGLLSLVGLGPGGPTQRTPAADAALRTADVVVGFGPYLDQCADALHPGQRVHRGGMGEEAERAAAAVGAACEGGRVALVSSGDAGIYGMATLALEAAAGVPEEIRPRVEIVPGVTAAVAAAALLGAPLGHDFACITLSDLLTPWEVVERRLRAVATADLAVALYNPRSRQRTWQLDRAREVLLEHRPAETPVGVVTDAFRESQEVGLTTLATMDTSAVGMRTIVVVGASNTRRVGGWMVAARHSAAPAEPAAP